jgi:hypothetical protein
LLAREQRERDPGEQKLKRREWMKHARVEIADSLDRMRSDGYRETQQDE